MSCCKSNRERNETIVFDSINIDSIEIPINPLDTTGDGLPIFYNMYLSVELSSLFETAGAIYTPELMNNIDKTSEYVTSSQQAINLGVYAVDLSYARVFDQVEMAGRYFNAMKQLAQELGIPDDYFGNTVKRFERNFMNKDSLIRLANEVYVTTDEYLKENERYTAAALIILGGWIEAIHIAVDVAIESKDPDIIERLIDQKYSLNNLLMMLSEHRKNEVVAEYINRLTRVKKDFENIDVVFDVDFNPSSEKGKQLINKAVEQIKVFGKGISALRKDLVE
jgi:transcriptional regulator with XRE-family HTH domain